MKIEIDQSGKIEITNRLTIVAYSNSKHKSILISAKDKKSVQSLLRKIGQPKLYIFKLFSVAIYCLIKEEIGDNNQIVIDREYPGYENLIKDMLVEIASRNGQMLDRKLIHFSSIGRKSSAH